MFFWMSPGIKEADKEEMTLMASTPLIAHIFAVADFALIKSVHKALVTQVCAGVDDQLSALVSGEEGEGRSAFGARRPEDAETICFSFP